VRENFGSTLFHIDGPVGTSSAATTLMFHGALIHDNVSSGPLASATGSGHIVVTGSTLSANRTGPDLFVFDYAVSLTASIVFEDAQRIGNPAEGVYARDVLLRDASGLSPIVGLVLADPKFVDAANGNFRLKPDSPALDRTILLPPGWPERDNRPRSTDLPGIGIPGMPQDLGCFERQIGD
jgi:hypothetical protein